MPTYLLPNLLAGVRAFLAAHADVTALCDGRVYALRTPPSPTYPLVLLSEVVETAMIADTDKLAESRIQIEAYGRDSHDEAAARTLAATCHAALHALQDETGFAGALSGDRAGVAGLQALPDTELGKARWLFETRVFGFTPRGGA